MSAASYEVPEAIAEHVRLRDRSCVFPHCGRDARGCDHIEPWDEGGSTTTGNVAALCRRHHRLRPTASGGATGCCILTPTSGPRRTVNAVLRDPSGTYTL